MSSSRGISESTERPSRRFPTPGYGAIFVIIVLALTALFSSCYGADNNPRLSISAPISAEARSNASGDSLLYPVRDMRWVTDSALPGLGSPANVYQVVRLEQGNAAGRDALKRFAEHFGRTGEATNTEGITTIEVTTPDSTNGVPATGVASLYGEVATSVSMPMNTLSYSATPSWAQYSQGSSTGGSSSGGSSTGSGSSTPPVTINSEVPITAPPSVPVDLPKNAALLRIAHDVLSAAGIDSSGWQSTINDASAMSSGVSCEPETACDQQESTTILSRQVVLTPLVDSIPVHDLDWYVEVGDKGAVLNASGAWVKTERVGEYSRRGTLNAVAALQAGEGGLGYGWLPMAAAEGKPTALSSNAVPPNAAPSNAATSNAVPPSAATSNSLCSNTRSSDMPVQADSSSEPIVVTIKRVEAGYSLQFGAINGKDAALLVPTYTFFGSSTADGSSTPTLPETNSGVATDPINEEITLNALDPSLFAPLVPKPGDDPNSPPGPRPLAPPEPQAVDPQPEPAPAPIPNSSPSPAPADNSK